MGTSGDTKSCTNNYSWSIYRAEKAVWVCHKGSTHKNNYISKGGVIACVYLYKFVFDVEIGLLIYCCGLMTGG